MALLALEKGGSELPHITQFILLRDWQKTDPKGNLLGLNEERFSFQNGCLFFGSTGSIPPSWALSLNIIQGLQ